MNLSFVVNKQCKTFRPLNFRQEGIEILPNKEYVTPRFFADDYTFFRFQINIDMDANEEGVQKGITQDNLKVYYQDKNRGEQLGGVANGMFAEVPYRITGAIDISSTVIYSDGDIPIYNDDFFLVIKNLSNDSILLRNITVKLLR